MRAFLFLIFLLSSVEVSPILWASGHEEATSNERNVTSWAIRGRMIHLGVDPNAPPELGKPTGDFASVSAPQDVVRSAGGILFGFPKTWTVLKFPNYADSGKTVVVLDDKRGGRLIFSVSKTRWARLGCKELIAINDIMRNRARNLGSPKLMVEYLEEMMVLCKGPQRVVMSKGFLEIAKGGWYMWLRGKASKPEHLVRLCFNPIITKKSANAEIRFNAITNNGSVERWLLECRWEKAVSITRISVLELEPPGMFSFGLIN